MAIQFDVGTFLRAAQASHTVPVNWGIVVLRSGLRDSALDLKKDILSQLKSLRDQNKWCKDYMVKVTDCMFVAISDVLYYLSTRGLESQYDATNKVKMSNASPHFKYVEFKSAVLLM